MNEKLFEFLKKNTPLNNEELRELMWWIWVL